MKTLADLKAVACAATPGTRKWHESTEIKQRPYSGEPSLVNSDGKFVLGYAGCGSHEISIGTNDATYIATFTPELVKAMIEEIESARRYDSQTADIGLFEERNEARERLDALLKELV